MYNQTVTMNVLKGKPTDQMSDGCTHQIMAQPRTIEWMLTFPVDLSLRRAAKHRLII